MRSMDQEFFQQKIKSLRTWSEFWIKSESLIALLGSWLSKHLPGDVAEEVTLYFQLSTFFIHIFEMDKILGFSLKIAHLNISIHTRLDVRNSQVPSPHMIKF